MTDLRQRRFAPEVRERAVHSSKSIVQAKRRIHTARAAGIEGRQALLRERPFVPSGPRGERVQTHMN